MRVNKTVIAAGLLFAISLPGCRKFMEPSVPENVLTADLVFLNDSTAAEVMAGLYYKIMSTQSLLNGSVSKYAALAADELISNSIAGDDTQFYENALSPGTGALLTYLWKPGYYIIHFTNTCIEKLPESRGISTALKKRFIGEAKLIRGLCYWYLVNLFGDVPLTTSSVLSEKMLLPRDPVSWVFLQIQDDFRQAMALLPDSNVNTVPGKYAAIALLARTACYLKEWSKAEEYSTMVINSRKYAFPNNINMVFASEGPEIIFQLPPASTDYSTFEGFSFIPVSNSVIPSLVLSESLINSFEAGDQRKANWVRNISVNGRVYYYPYKYRIKNIKSDLEYNVIIRLAELFLIRAEARARLGNISGAVADLNLIRNRAGLDSISSSITLQEFLQQIDQERKLEFFTEWGHRWFDLKRTNRIDAVMSAYKGAKWQSFDKLLPIPSAEMQRNRMLIQNKGYE